MFEPAAQGEGPSGLADWPRPFVFRASHLDGRTVRAGAPFHFDLHVVDLREPALAYFVLAFAQVAREGLGPRRGRARLDSMWQLDANGQPGIRIYVGEAFRVEQPPGPLLLSLAPETAVSRVTVRFVTPTELKSEQRVVERPEFSILLGRARDRVSTLRTLYGDGPLDIDFRGMGERAAGVRMTRCELRHIEAERRSSRTGQVHRIGGFVGEADYEGELGEFLPYLRVARWVGVGRQTVGGTGELRVG
jgi:hypothetical protein